MIALLSMEEMGCEQEGDPNGTLAAPIWDCDFPKNKWLHFLGGMKFHWFLWLPDEGVAGLGSGYEFSGNMG